MRIIAAIIRLKVLTRTIVLRNSMAITQQSLSKEKQKISSSKIMKTFSIQKVC